VLRILNETNGTVSAFPVRPEGLADLIGRVKKGDFDTSRAREIFAEMVSSGRPVDDVVAGMGISAISDDDVIALCRELLAANPKIVADVKSGKEQAAAGLIGQAKKKNANVNPGKVREKCLELIRAMG
jgi:aspartyl-tRNA(Asn)/glutamyl-tRNA(Gln) amidotransferase subunit B